MKKLLSILLVVAMAVTMLCACGDKSGGENQGNGGNGGTDLSAQEILEKSQEAHANVKSCALEMEMDFDIAMKYQGMSINMSMEMDAESQVDMENKAMHQDIDMTVSTMGQNQTMEAEIYLVDGQVYTGSNGAWMKVAATEEQLASMGGASAGKMEMDYDSMDMRVMGTENVDGVKCYIVKMDMDWDTFMKLYNQMGSGTEQAEAIFANGDSLFSGNEKFITAEYYIMADTFYIKKINIDLTDVFGKLISASVSQQIGENIDADVQVGKLSVEYDSFNDVDPITVPDEVMAQVQ